MIGTVQYAHICGLEMLITEINRLLIHVILWMKPSELYCYNDRNVDESQMYKDGSQGMVTNRGRDWS